MTEDTNAKFDGIKERTNTPPPSYFNILFYGLIIWGVIFSGYYIFSGWSSKAEFQQKMDSYKQQYQNGQTDLEIRQR